MPTPIITPMSTLPTTNTLGDGDSQQAALSQDGRLIVFTSDALNLSSKAFGISNIYLKNTDSGAVILLNMTATGTVADSTSSQPDISGDGRLVVFQSYGSNLTTRDTNNDSDVFLKDTQTGVLKLISATATGRVGDGFSGNPDISTDGRYVVFQSQASNLMEGDLNGAFDIYLRDLQTNTLSVLSRNADLLMGNGDSVTPSINADGRLVAFASDASNLVANDRNAARDVFLKNTQTGAITLISANGLGASGYGFSDSPSISADGSRVAFRSYATDLADVENDGNADIYVRDLTTGALTVVSAGLDGKSANGNSFDPVISADGRYVAFVSEATNLIPSDSNDMLDVFVADLTTGKITRVDWSSTPGDSGNPAFSGDGKTLAFNHWDNVSNNVYTWVNTTTSQTPINPPNNGGGGQPVSSVVTLAFASTAISVTEGNSGISNAMLTVNLSKAATQRVTVNYNTVDGSALEDNDYVGTNGTLIFEAGQTSKTIRIPIVSDTSTEDKTENLQVVLSAPVNASLGSADKATITIEDDDDAPLVQVAFASSTATVKEGNSGISNALVTVNLSQATTQRITVDYSTLDDTALEDDDYVFTESTLIFEAGQTSQTIKVPIIGDTLKESDETFMLSLSSPVNATLGELSDALITITDDDSIIRGTPGADNLTGTAGNDTLDGLAGNDRLLAQAGNDVLIGGLGRDLLGGGTGSDIFDFNDVLDSGITSTTRDQIGDFKTTERDKIDLSTIDANTALAGDQSFTYIGALAFSAPGQIRFNPQERVLYGSNDADTTPEFSILLSGVKTMTAADFVL